MVLEGEYILKQMEKYGVISPDLSNNPEDLPITQE